MRKCLYADKPCGTCLHRKRHTCVIAMDCHGYDKWHAKGTTMKMRKGYRLITVGPRQWQWGMGKQMVTAICEDGTHLRTDLSKLLHMDWDTIERGQ